MRLAHPVGLMAQEMKLRFQLVDGTCSVFHSSYPSYRASALPRGFRLGVCNSLGGRCSVSYTRYDLFSSLWLPSHGCLPGPLSRPGPSVSTHRTECRVFTGPGPLAGPG